MEGIKVLSTQTHYEITLLCLILIIAAVSLIIFAYIMKPCKKKKVIAISLFLLLTPFLASNNRLLKIPYNVYEVKVEDELNFNDFMEHYEIISSENEIYTVREIKEK